MASCFVALGGNQGQVCESFDHVVLHDLPWGGFIVKRSSDFFRTIAWVMEGSSPQADYWNAVVEVSSSKSPQDTLRALLAIEARHGRVRQTRWSPRPLDLDLLSYDDRIIDDEQLTVPHAGLMRRPFVLGPLVTIAPGWRVPGDGRSIRELWAELGCGESVLLERRPAPLRRNETAEEAEV